MEGGRHCEIIQGMSHGASGSVWLWELQPCQSHRGSAPALQPLQRSGDLPRSSWVSHEVSGSTPVLTVLGLTSIEIFLEVWP